MSYRLTDGYLRPNADGYVRLFKDGYSPFLTHDGYNVALFSPSGTVFDGGKGIAYLADRTTAPDGYQPSGGGWMYSGNGDGYWSSSHGVVQSISNTRIVKQLTTDTNYTAAQTEYQANIMEFTSSVSLTATRNIVVPITSSYKWIVFNNTTGAQSLQFIGASGTGVTVANGKRATLYSDGTNIVRATADV